MKFKCIVEYEYPVEHKPPVKAELILHGDRVVTDKITPLPKGHGRLIDENELLKMTECYKSELGRLKADPFVKCGIETVESFIKEMPTIIEADKGETE